MPWGGPSAASTETGGGRGACEVLGQMPTTAATRSGELCMALTMGSRRLLSPRVPSMALASRSAKLDELGGSVAQEGPSCDSYAAERHRFLLSGGATDEKAMQWKCRLSRGIAEGDLPTNA